MFMAARGGRRATVGVSALALVLLLGACAETGSSTRSSGEDTPQIGLKRGGSWSVLTLKPPHLTGPLFNLMLKDGVLSGSISGGTSPGGTLHVSIAEDGAEGHGPLGPVSMEFITTEDSTTAEGMWNGHRVHLVFAKDSVKGTVADNSDIMTRGDPEASQGQPALRAYRARSPQAANMIDPLPANSSCEYFLTETTPEGALTGGSICSGMPQQTRLEVPHVAQSYLTRPELVTVLVAVLSAPPQVVSEEMGPKFDTNPPKPPVSLPPVQRRR
jgi:hypothetical protein